MRKEIATNERKWDVNNLSMRMQRCGTLLENETCRPKNKVNRAIYPMNFLFRDFHAFRMADPQKTKRSQLSGHELY